MLTDVIPPYEHAFLGLLPERRDPLAGVGIRYLYADGVLAAAGLQPGDRVLKLNDQPLQDANQLRELLATLQPGETVQVIWQHADADQTTAVPLGRLPESLPDELPPPNADGPAGNLTTGKLAIEVPEEPNRCTGLCPEFTESRSARWIAGSC